ncbi:MAG: 50S ribosomal protein L9 [Endomicrobium sp.]|jgi:large subunit ribosomal protein L9|nr:50S ribosomal protein L9 [Endomicrobium sp.]
MKVMLISNIQKVGNIGTIKDVAPGFARNYLFPKKLAVAANKKNLLKFKNYIQHKAKTENKILDDAKIIASKLNNIELCMKIKLGQNHKTFGVITNSKIADVLMKQHKIKIDKHKILLSETINYPGKYNINIKLHPQVVSTLNIVVSDDK